MKIISFSLWGSNPIYTVGAVKNAVIAADLFPNWVCVFYCFKSVPISIVNQLIEMPNVDVRMVSDEYNQLDNRGMFHRFLPADQVGVEYMISRDTDSRLSAREKVAVDEWLASGADFHLIRDHPYHGVPILGGMWGVKGGRLKGIDHAIRKFKPTSLKGQDQQFLKDWVWQKYIEGQLTAIIHDPFFTGKPFPEKAKRGDKNGGVWFVGQVFDQFDRFNSQHDVDMLLGL
jgi:hypothetical protein